MATPIPSSNINIPYSPFIDLATGRPNQEWMMWLMNPSVISFQTNNTIINGGTIDNVTINNSTIGLTTPAAGKFTDFTALNGVKGGVF
jgi:hypothetical protein